MNREEIDQLVSTCEHMLQSGKSVEDIISFLRRRIGRKFVSIVVVKRLLNISMHEARLLVHTSRIWSDLRGRDEPFPSPDISALVQLVNDQEIITNLVIRPATQADFEQVGRIFAQELAFHCGLLPDMFNLADPIMTREWYEDKLTAPGKALFVAERGESILSLDVGSAERCGFFENEPASEDAYSSHLKQTQIVGVLQVEIRTNPADPIFKTRRYAYVADLAVAEDFRGRGIGRLLMDRAREWATEQGANEIELQVWELNTRAIRFYDRLGYETKRRTMRLVLEK